MEAYLFCVSLEVLWVKRPALLHRHRFSYKKTKICPRRDRHTDTNSKIRKQTQSYQSYPERFTHLRRKHAFKTFLLFSERTTIKTYSISFVGKCVLTFFSFYYCLKCSERLRENKVVATGWTCPPHFCQRSFLRLMQIRFSSLGGFAP